MASVWVLAWSRFLPSTLEVGRAPVRVVSADTLGCVAEPLANETTSAMTGFIFEEWWGWVGAYGVCGAVPLLLLCWLVSK